MENVAKIESQCIADILVSNASLQEFSFRGSFSDSKYLKTIMPTLRDHKTLQTLNYTDNRMLLYSHDATRSTLKMLWDNHVMKKVTVNFETRDTNPTIAFLVDRNMFQFKRLLSSHTVEALWPTILHKADTVNIALLFLLIKEKPELFGDCRKRSGGELTARPCKRQRLESKSILPGYEKWKSVFCAAVSRNFLR